MSVCTVQSLIPALLLVAGLTLGCDKPGGSSPPVAGASGSAGGGGGGGGGGAAAPGEAGGGGGGGSSEPAPPPCEPVLDTQPTSFFAHRIILTLPKGVELVEQNPFFARSTTSGQMSSCGVPVPFAAVGFLRSTSTVPLIRKHVLMLRGLDVDAVTFGADASQGDTTVTPYEIAASSRGEPAIRGLALIRRDRGWFYWVLLESAPEDFAKVEMLFRSALGSLVIRSVRE